MPNFKQVMDSAELSSDRISLNIDETWTQGRTVYGGMQGAIAVKAMRQQVGHELPLRSLQITFVGPVEPGEVVATASLLRQGKSASHAQAQIIQGGELRLFALGIFAKDRSSEAVHNPPMQPTLSPEYGKEMVRDNGPAFVEHFESRVIEGAPLFSGGDGVSAKIYARHCNDTGCSYEHLIALADIAPPLALVKLTHPAPGSSMNWQLDFVRQPEQVAGTEWFRIDSETVACENGYSWQNTAIWTDKGELVMVGRQCMAVFG